MIFFPGKSTSPIGEFFCYIQVMEELSFPESALRYILSDEVTTVGKVAEKVHVLQPFVLTLYYAIR